MLTNPGKETIEIQENDRNKANQTETKARNLKQTNKNEKSEQTNETKTNIE